VGPLFGQLDLANIACIYIASGFELYIMFKIPSKFIILPITVPLIRRVVLRLKPGLVRDQKVLINFLIFTSTNPGILYLTTCFIPLSFYKKCSQGYQK